MPMPSIRKRDTLKSNREALDEAAQHTRLSGLQASPYALELFEQLARNELTAEEVREKLKAHHSTRAKSGG
jgi:hypothetical protein